MITALLRYMGRHPAHLIYSSLSNGRPFTAAILQLLSINEDGFMCDSFWDESSCGIAFISILVAILGGVLLAGCGGSSSGPVGPVSSSGSFTVCSSTYALCTGSPCTPVADAPGFDACNCRVMTGYSAGQAPCQDVQETGEAQAIFSRYYPITSYTPCSNDRPWANCLDSPCLINNGDPTAATCICTEMKNQGTYIFMIRPENTVRPRAALVYIPWQRLRAQTKLRNTYKHTTRLSKRRRSRSTDGGSAL